MTVVLETRVVSGAGGGPDKTILNSPRFLTSAGYRTLCAYMHPPSDPGFDELRKKAEQWGAPLVEVPDRGALDWRVARRLLDVCRREKVAIWHGHDYKSNALGLLLRRFHRMRLVTTVHGWVQHTRKTPLYYWIDRLCLPRYERVICVSEDLLKRCAECGVSAKSCALIENGIDTEQFQRRSTVAEAKARAGVPVGRRLIGAVGRLSAEKGFDLLIRAVARLLAAGKDVELWIAGEGDERPKLEALVADCGLAGRVRLLGYCNDTREVYHALDLFALSSLREGLPNVLLEAMALEVPVVATRIAGVPRLIQDGVNGRLVEPGDEEGLARALGQLLDGPPLQARFRKAGRETIVGRYGFAARMEKVRQLYDDLLKPRL
jgi:glycosyltransferase involved in cell wall biosynthesis